MNRTPEFPTPDADPGGAMPKARAGGTVPLYKKIKAKLRGQIVSGELLQGALLPSETEIAEQFGCSRLTVHRALRELAEEGVLERRRRAGTRVAANGPTGLMIRMPVVSEEIRRRGYDYRYEMLSAESEKVAPDVSGPLGVSPDETLMHVVCRHWAGDRVFQLEDRWINGAVAENVDTADFSTEAPSAWLLKNIPLSEVEHEIFAVCVQGDLVDLMETGAGSPAFEFFRRSIWAGKPVSLARLIVAGDLFSLKSERKAP